MLSPLLFLIMMNDYPEPSWEGNQRNFVVQYAYDILEQFEQF